MWFGWRISCLLSPVHRVGQTLQRGVEGCILLGEAETHHRGYGILLVKRRHRDRRHLVVGHDTLAERLVGLAETEGRKGESEKVEPKRAKPREADALKPRRQPVAAARQIGAHLVEIIRRL